MKHRFRYDTGSGMIPVYETLDPLVVTGCSFCLSVRGAGLPLYSPEGTLEMRPLRSPKTIPQPNATYFRGSSKGSTAIGLSSILLGYGMELWDVTYFETSRTDLPTYKATSPRCHSVV
ncbi:hypothetical protein AVEN_38710-1 [Araneus ventricosus]|uniref:Uncharacterized protein n=1 Tax=Araneus ventricosus TaxID=182803 RepID=A0A4Y2GUM2_ARAVE|nr:hypothetical protein AVEN_38710-1 [Araneus ventricosus]